MFWDDYIRVESVDEALYELHRLNGDGRIIAGGTDLIIQLKTGKEKTKCLIDISSVSSLCNITQTNGKVSIGASTTHSQINNAPLIRTKAPVLCEACGQIGSPQIRNIGTVGGNIVNAQPAADSVIALLALNATCVIVAGKSHKEMPIGELFSGPGISTIDRTRSILTSITFDALGASEGCAFYRLTRRKAATLPILNCAVYLRWNSKEEKISDIRIAMGPVAPTPIRLLKTEKVLKSDTFSRKLMQEASNKTFEEVNPRTSLRGGGEYRKEMAKVIMERAILKALEMAGCKDGRHR